MKVLAVTSNCASPNHNLLHMHFLMTKEDGINPDTDVTTWTVNLFRSKFFLHPHMMKTSQNGLYNSSKGRYT